MSNFECKVIQIMDIQEHPNADKLEIIKILDGYQVVSQKGIHLRGDVVVYIPEAAILPVPIQEELGLVGLLSGPNKDRLKAIKLRGELSQGMLLKVSALDFNVDLGDDVAEQLGIVKYVPRVPANFSGKWVSCPTEFEPTKYDLENIKKVGGFFGDGEEVAITEKLHGTFCQVILLRDQEDYEGFLNLGDGYQVGVTSKGVGAQGFLMDPYDADAEKNIYIKAMKKYFDLPTVNEIFDSVDDMRPTFGSGNIDCIQVMGEIYGMGIQDLSYGTTEPNFRYFDVRVQNIHGRHYLSHGALKHFSESLEMVPIVYEGPYHRSLLVQHSHGQSVLNDGQIREGAVVRPIVERQSHRQGRVIAKSVSEQYLLRKGSKGAKPTEYN